MKKIKRAISNFSAAVVAEIQRFNDFMDRADAEWEADPEGAARRFDAAFSRWAWRVVGISTLAMVLDSIFSVWK